MALVAIEPLPPPPLYATAVAEAGVGGHGGLPGGKLKMPLLLSSCEVCVAGFVAAPRAVSHHAGIPTAVAVEL